VARDLGQVVTTLIGAGLTIKGLRESDETSRPGWAHMVPGDDGFWSYRVGG
jgi:hypothetical protein